MEELKTRLHSLDHKLNEIILKLNPDQLKQTLRRLEAQTLQPGFWDNETQARQVSQELADTAHLLDQITQLTAKIQEIFALIALASQETESAPLTKDLHQEINTLAHQVDQLEINIFLSGPHDRSPAILSLHAGQGGVEAMDWTAMLLRMYLRYFEKKGWPSTLIAQTPGEEAGLKSAAVKVDSPYAYGYLKHESGTHRLVRQSPFNADNLRQTSFALAEILPVLPAAEAIKVKDEELLFQAFRSHGKGGQNVNKVSTAVRLKHLPSGIVIECQTQRYQEQNRKIALELLQARLWALEEQKRQRQLRDLKGTQTFAGWGTQIRSYVLHPYKMIKDLRTQVESACPEAVLDGGLDLFIQTEVRQLA